MKRFFLIVILISCNAIGMQAQQKTSKPPINNETHKTWKTLGQYNISNDGRYAWYEYGLENLRECSLVVCMTNSRYKKEFPFYSRSAIFTADSQRLIFTSPKGLVIYDMGKDSVQYIQHTGRYSVPKEGNGRWLSYWNQDGVILKDLVSGQEKKYPKAKASWFNEQGTILIVQTSTGILQIFLPSGEEKTILHGGSTNNIAFDATGTKIAFIASGKHGNALRYYQSGMDSASVHVTNNSLGIQNGFVVANEVPQFTDDGQRLFFKLSAPNVVIPKDSSVITDKVEVWHYKDKYLFSHQLEEVLPESMWRTYAAIVSVNSRRVIQLESADTKLNWPMSRKPNRKSVLTSDVVNDYETYWNKKEIPNYQLVTLLDGKRKNILSDLRAVLYCQLSPDERFVTWYDREKKNYFSYEVSTGITRNITGAIKVPLYMDEDRHLPTYGFPHETAGWIKGDNALLIYDQYDIWQVDPRNKKAPRNVTGGYGREHRITFRIAGDDFGQINTDTLLLAALNRDNKYNGFWKKGIESSGAPIQCSEMAPSLYYFPNMFHGQPSPPVKAKDAEVYILQNQSAQQASNVVVTKDFQSFTSLSDIHPEKEYNWVTSELIRYQMPDDKSGEGILYKPQDFDPQKKYPLIFYYYDKMSKRLFSFQKPGLSFGMLNIPLFVSNGYLVCIPNIYYTPGHTGQSVVHSVESAAKHLSKFPWVDVTKMGLQGHSFGGYETNYLITHSTLFAAAQESAGPSNLITTYGGIAFGGRSTAFQAETGQDGLGTTPWQRPDIYIENSPVFSVDKVRTPLLMMHNKGDGQVPFGQALEMFTALRRLQKPAWLLQYNDQGHTLFDEACQLDFTIRQQQFFDYYLKGKPAPIWMLEGIPAKYQGLKSGLGFSSQ